MFPKNFDPFSVFAASVITSDGASKPVFLGAVARVHTSAFGHTVCRPFILSETSSQDINTYAIGVKESSYA